MSSQENGEFPCKVQGCKSRPLKSSKTFENHMKKVHPSVNIGEKSSPTSNNTTSSTLPPTSAPTSLLSTPADSPPLPDQTIEEMYNDNEWMEAVAEEVKLMTEMEQMTEEDMEEESSNNQVVNQLKEKMERFKTIANKKSSVVKSLKEVKDKLVYDIKMRKEVEIKKEEKIDEQEEIIKDVKDQMKSVKERNLVILVEQKKMKRDQKEHEKDLKELRDINGEVAKINATLKIKLKKKDDLIESLKELSGIEESDEENEERTNESIVFDKETSGTLCLICDKPFPQKRALEQHMEAKHNQGECPLCDELFPLGITLEKHTDECMDKLQDKAHECPDCRNTFLTRKALKSHMSKHKKKCIEKATKYACSNCKMIIHNETELQNHERRCTGEVQHGKVRSNIVCKHWRRGNCTRGDSCGFSHVGHQSTESSEHNSTKSTEYTQACKHGLACSWLAKGICSYFHQNVGVQKPWITKNKTEKPQNIQPQKGHSFSQASVRPVCKFGARCTKVPDCTFLHLMADFPTLQMANQQKRTVKKSNWKQ